MARYYIMKRDLAETRDWVMNEFTQKAKELAGLVDELVGDGRTTLRRLAPLRYR
jgi:hypothetical protein